MLTAAVIISTHEPEDPIGPPLIHAVCMHLERCVGQGIRIIAESPRNLFLTEIKILW